MLVTRHLILLIHKWEPNTSETDYLMLLYPV